MSLRSYYIMKNEPCYNNGVELVRLTGLQTIGGIDKYFSIIVPIGFILNDSVKFKHVVGQERVIIKQRWESCILKTAMEQLKIIDNNIVFVGDKVKVNSKSRTHKNAEFVVENLHYRKYKNMYTYNVNGYQKDVFVRINTINLTVLSRGENAICEVSELLKCGQSTNNFKPKDAILYIA